MMNPVERQSRILERDAAHGVEMRKRQEQERASRPLKAAGPGDSYGNAMTTEELNALNDRREELLRDRAAAHVLAREEGRA